MHVRATGNNALKTKGELTADALTLEFFTATLATCNKTKHCFDTKQNNSLTSLHSYSQFRSLIPIPALLDGFTCLHALVYVK